MAARPAGLKIVAVTVLTSLDDEDLADAGYDKTADALVRRRIASARELGADALVCSPREAALAAQSGLTVITPGVRMASDGVGEPEARGNARGRRRGRRRHDRRRPADHRGRRSGRGGAALIRRPSPTGSLIAAGRPAAARAG
ncbi:MAG: hypothetical protein AcusKO_10660 [Acuticoccus sp.]